MRKNTSVAGNKFNVNYLLTKINSLFSNSSSTWVEEKHEN